MAHRCPWWIGYLLVNPLRRLWQDPHAILAPHLTPGMTVLEPGPGMGFFTLELARLVGPTGHVVAVDVQPRMLSALRRRAARRGVAERIETRLAGEDGLDVGDLAGRVDFALLFAMVHEVADRGSLLAEVAATLRPGGTVLLAEPRGHVSEALFSKLVDAAKANRFDVVARPDIPASRAALLARS